MTSGCMGYVWYGYGAVFTYNDLLIRGCGRTAFQQEISDTLYISVWNKLFTLPDYYLAYSAHGYTSISLDIASQEVYQAFIRIFT